MDNNFSQRICDEKHKQINYRLDVSEKRLNDHGERLDALEQNRSRTEARIDNLCEKIESLVATMKWLIGAMVGALGGFFFYVIQQGIFR